VVLKNKISVMKSLFYGLQNWYGCALQDTLAAHHTGTPGELLVVLVGGATGRPAPQPYQHQH